MTSAQLALAAGVSPDDVALFDVPCSSASTARCALTGQHTSLDHYVIGLAEAGLR